jgi:acyl carrier protein
LPAWLYCAAQEVEVNPGDLILRRCQEVVDDSALDWDDNLYEAGMDSLSLLELSDLLSVDAGISVQLTELFNCVTATDIAALLQAQVPSGGPP